MGDLVILITAIFEAVTATFCFNRLDDSEGISNSVGQIQLQMKAYEDHVNAILIYFDSPVNDDKNDDIIDTMYDKVSFYRVVQIGRRTGGKEGDFHFKIGTHCFTTHMN